MPAWKQGHLVGLVQLSVTTVRPAWDAGTARGCQLLGKLCVLQPSPLLQTPTLSLPSHHRPGGPCLRMLPAYSPPAIKPHKSSNQGRGRRVRAAGPMGSRSSHAGSDNSCKSVMAGSVLSTPSPAGSRYVIEPGSCISCSHCSSSSRSSPLCSIQCAFFHLLSETH